MVGMKYILWQDVIFIQRDETVSERTYVDQYNLKIAYEEFGRIYWSEAVISDTNVSGIMKEEDIPWGGRFYADITVLLRGLAMPEPFSELDANGEMAEKTSGFERKEV